MPRKVTQRISRVRYSPVCPVEDDRPAAAIEAAEQAVAARKRVLEERAKQLEEMRYGYTSMEVDRDGR